MRDPPLIFPFITSSCFLRETPESRWLQGPKTRLYLACRPMWQLQAKQDTGERAMSPTVLLKWQGEGSGERVGSWIQTGRVWE